MTPEEAASVIQISRSSAQSDRRGGVRLVRCCLARLTSSAIRLAGPRQSNPPTRQGEVPPATWGGLGTLLAGQGQNSAYSGGLRKKDFSSNRSKAGRRSGMRLTAWRLATHRGAQADVLRNGPIVADTDDSETLSVNCGRCGKRLNVRLVELLDKHTIDCSNCEQRTTRPRRTYSLSRARIWRECG
jgi:hypothetical protein